MAHTILNLFF
ncbi:unnamed protein product [Linum tenue]|uniref:Uncharacterized protein n=1 Tax=Linum tenue TaxID=586396 RepID=A0AAV0IQV0_9ROSI|nr:unnamed protein product [Linum tenue]